MATVADLRYGQKGIIKDFTEHILPIKLMELGCLPGNSVELLQIAPLNDPIYINLSGSHLAIRRSLAALIELDIIEETQAK
ncbi:MULTISPECIES: FeoA family protein [Flavobacteriaceae]|uniref:FeoA family protein n=1 Tax=Flagellimonas halotolerans TaxID=3112164 RepID=A0ABU6ILY1_9FLAO|nr:MULTISPECIES: FeoA family protein [unclassified Allomuricauda]MBA4745537.1 ferrous iron transport protein A [Allomuricauda sp.]MEC3964164.1 FeoA family protein [Muricauda sp. SYSU M86414]MEC4264034.1 FeoA family protein [Muricauda sp. SYSU M84420]NDV14399.1 ferrous iron transport protein A [Muricauda sp. TY007]